MVFKKTLALGVLSVVLSSCGPVMRKITLCRVAEVSDCARGDKKFQTKLSAMDGWMAVDDLSLQKVAEKLAECEARDSLPSGATLKEIEVCKILPQESKVVCSWMSIDAEHDISYVHGYVSTTPAGYQSIKSRLNFCGEKN